MSLSLFSISLILFSVWSNLLFTPFYLFISIIYLFLEVLFFSIFFYILKYSKYILPYIQYLIIPGSEVFGFVVCCCRWHLFLSVCVRMHILIIISPQFLKFWVGILWGLRENPYFRLEYWGHDIIRSSSIRFYWSTLGPQRCVITGLHGVVYPG